MCVLDLESLESKLWIDGFSNVEATTDATVRLAIAGTGWSVETKNLTTKKRTLRLDSTNAYEIITKALSKWDIEVHFNAKDKIITLSDNIGEDKGVYFTEELNLSTINIEGDSTDFATRLYVRGKDGLTFADINGGKDYIENFTYSDKVVSKLWIDERYEHKESMLEDARIKLEGMCKPIKSYELEIIDLASLSDDYDFLAYGIGDTVTLLSVSNKIRESHRIIEMTRYPLEPERNKAVLSNGRLTFEELQQKNEEMADTVGSWANEDGTLNGSKVDGILTEQITDFEAKVAQITDLTVVNAKIDNLEANKVSIGQLSAIQADIGELRATTAKITDLNVTNAKINFLEAGYVKVDGLLEASSAQIKVLEAETATIKHLVNGNLSSENIQAGGITSDKLTIANGFIKDAMIDSLNANKITAGQINTALVQVSSASGNLVINDNTIQIRDVNRVRVQIGKDASNDYSMSVWDSSGQLMFDARGLKANAIKDSIIRNDMISTDANIDGSKLNISSVVSSINNSSSTLKASKVQFDGIAQTLEVAFNALKTQADGTKTQTESNTTAINVAQGQIKTLIQDTTITTSIGSTKLKDAYSKLEQTVGSLSSTIGSQQTIIDDHTGKITSTNSELSTLKQSVNGLSASVSSAQTTINSHTTLINQKADLTAVNDKINSAKNELNTSINKKANAVDVYNKTDVYTRTETDSKIQIAKDAINLGVSQTYETKANVESKINGIQIGGRNLILNSKTILLNGSDYGNGNCSVVEEDYVKISPKNNGNVYNTAVYTSVNRIQGETYTLSFDILTPTQIGFYWYPSEKYSKPNYINADNKWQRVSFTYTQINADSTSTTAQLFGLQGLVGGQIYKYRNLKLEIGNKTTDWIPAPEDVQASIDTKANSVDVYTKTEVYTKSQTDSQINIAKDAINLGVSQTYETKTNVASQVTSTLNSAKSYADTKKSEAISSASSDATTKANNALNNAKSYADTKKNEAISSANNTLNTTIANYYTKTQTDSQINVAKNAITQSVSSTYETKTDSTTKYDTATAIAKAMNDGKIIHEDIAFRNGHNGLALYNNTGNGNVKLERITKPSDCPTTSTHCMRITTTGTASPGWGGFYQGISSRANAVFIQKIVAKVPTGYQLNVASNSMGTGYIDKWLTSNKGTGKWETYIRQVTCGSSGTFSGGGHVYASGGATPTASAPLVWYVASCTAIDITDTDERVSSLATRMSTAESKITDTAITNVVKQNFYTKSETDKQITSKGYQTSSQVQQTVDNLQIKFSQSGGYNLLRNGKATVTTNFWISNGGGISRGTDSVYKSCFKTSLPTGIKYNGGDSGGSIKLKNNTLYVYEAMVYSRTAIGGSATSPLHYWCSATAETGGQTQCTVVDYSQAVPNINTWTKCYVHFVTKPSGEVWFTPFVYTGGSLTGDIWVTELSLSESSIQMPYSPHPSEVYDGLTQIDKEGITVTASNVRSKTKMSADGFQLIRTTDNKKMFYVNQDGSLEMSGNFTQYDTNGKISIKIANNSYGCYDWLWDGDFVGNFGAFESNRTNTSGANQRFIGIANIADYGNQLVFGVRSSPNSTNFNTYMEIDNTGIMHRDYVTFTANTGFKTNAIFRNPSNNNETGRIFGATNDHFYVACNHHNQLRLGYEKNGTYYSAMSIYRNDNTSAGCAIEYYADELHHNNVVIDGFLSVKGQKNRLVATENFGDRLLNAYETAECYFGDINEAIIGEDGEVKVELDEVFLETVNTTETYHVFLAKYGEGDCYVSERHEKYFVIKGTPNLSVGFEVKAKQRGYEKERLKMTVDTLKSHQAMSYSPCSEDEAGYTIDCETTINRA